MNPLELLSGDPDTFIREVWGRRILVREIPPADLDGVFGIEQADHLITQTALRTPQMRMAKDGYRWDTSAVPLIKEATSCAIQITNGMPVSQIAKAVFWARQITAKTAADLEAA